MLGLEVVRKVADGSAVEAFLARRGSHQVLVQVSRPELACDAELYGRFLDRTRVATKQRAHPSLLTPRVSHCSSDGRFVLMSEPLSGRTARDHLRERGPLGVEEAARWALTLCDALEALHSNSVVHGHLSPENLFLFGDPERPDVKLLDTGLLLFRSSRSLEVVAGLVLVPPQYLAPERVAGYRATVRSDVYGLGVLLFELLTGSPPFLGRDHDETRDLHLTSPMPKLPGRVAAWDPVLRRCLEKEPEDRYGSMAEVRAEVLALAQPLRRPGPKVAPRSGLCARTPAPTPAVPVHDASCGSPPRAPEPETLEPGATLGSYRLEALLGEGGMGQVFVATHRTLGRRVAIKVLKAELAADPAQVSRFVQEAQAVNRVRHPNIVEVHDLVQEPAEAGGRIYFVMELLEGESLRRLSRKTPFELRRALRLVRQAADALAAAHDVGVVHRDVKPDNLFVVRDEAGAERVKVLDFGVARVRDASRGDLRTTRTGQVVGTPLWMAPEQILGRDVDARADIYSLMMVLYVLLVRRFPFDGASMSDVVMQRLEREAKAIGAHTSLGEPVPKALEQLLAECLSRDRSKRPGSMAEVAERLRDIEAGLSTHVTSPFDAQASPRRTWARWVALGAAGGGLAGLAARYWL